MIHPTAILLASYSQTTFLCVKRNTIMKNLFALIKSFSKEEKKAVTQYVQNQGKESTIYAVLLSEITKQTEMNEEVIKKKLEEEYELKYWSVSKAYLYDLILKILRNINRKSDSEKKILDGIQEVHILFKKRLFNAALKRVQGLKKIAIKYNHLYLLQLVYDWEMELEYILTAPLEVEEKITLWKGNTLDNIEAIQSYTKYNILKFESWYQTRIEGSRKLLDFVDVEVLKSSLKNNPTLAFTTRMKIMEMIGAYYIQAYDLPQVVNIMLDCVHEYEQSPHFIIEYKEKYLNVLSLLVVNASALCNWDLVDELLERYKQFKDKRISKTYEISCYNMYLARWIRTKACASKLEDIKKIEAALKKNKEQTIVKLETTFFRLAMAYFCAEELDRALDILHDLDKIEARRVNDFVRIKKLTEIMIFIEKEEWLLLPYKVESMYKKLSNANYPFNQFERAIISFLRKLSKEAGFQYSKLDYLRHKEALINILLSSEKGRHNFLIYFTYLCWLDSKVTSYSFQEVLSIESKTLCSRLLDYHI
jgi:hypothetical protein